MSSNMRVVWALYDWEEEVDFSKEINILDELLRTAHINPNRVKFLGKFGDGPRRVIGKSTDKSKVYSIFPSYRAMSLHDTRGTDFSATNGSMVIQYDSEPKRYSCVLPLKMYNQENAIENIGYFTKFHSVKFGYSFKALGTRADAYPSFSITDATTEQIDRMKSLRTMINKDKSYLAGKLHDVYELNVLNSSHLTHPCAGTNLALWIAASGIGKLISINEKVHIWTVPPELKPKASAVLRFNGMLTIPEGI